MAGSFIITPYDAVGGNAGNDIKFNKVSSVTGSYSNAAPPPGVGQLNYYNLIDSNGDGYYDYNMDQSDTTTEHVVGLTPVGNADLMSFTGYNKTELSATFSKFIIKNKVKSGPGGYAAGAKLEIDFLNETFSGEYASYGADYYGFSGTDTAKVCKWYVDALNGYDVFIQLKAGDTGGGDTGGGDTGGGDTGGGGSGSFIITPYDAVGGNAGNDIKFNKVSSVTGSYSNAAPPPGVGQLNYYNLIDSNGDGYYDYNMDQSDTTTEHVVGLTPVGNADLMSFTGYNKTELSATFSKFIIKNKVKSGPGGYAAGAKLEIDFLNETFSGEYASYGADYYGFSGTDTAKVCKWYVDALNGYDVIIQLKEGGGGTVAKPEATGLTNASVNVVQGADTTTTDKLSDMFTGDDITYSYTATENGESTGDVYAETSGDNVKISATGGATPGSYVVTVTATNGGGSATKTISVTVVAANQGPVSAGEFEDVTVGKSLKGGTLYVENFKSKFSDPDGDTLTYTITSSATSVCTATENGNNIDLVFQDGMETGQSTITIQATDGSNTPLTKTFTVSIVNPKKVYVWTVSELQNATMTTVIKMQIVDTTISIPGVHLKYTLTDEANYASKPGINAAYQQSGNNPWSADSAIYTKDWTHQLINTTTPGKEYIVLFDTVSKKLTPGTYDLMYFTGVKFDIDIIGLSDQYGNMISYDDILNQSPPKIFEDTTVDPVTGQKYGDVNVDTFVNADDVEMLSRYLVRDNRVYVEPVSEVTVQGAITKIETEIAAFAESGSYVSLGLAAGGVEDSTGKAFSHIDVDRDGIISVADLCRLAEVLENASYNIIG